MTSCCFFMLLYFVSSWLNTASSLFGCGWTAKTASNSSNRSYRARIALSLFPSSVLISALGGISLYPDILPVSLDLMQTSWCWSPPFCFWLAQESHNELKCQINWTCLPSLVKLPSWGIKFLQRRSVAPLAVGCPRNECPTEWRFLQRRSVAPLAVGYLSSKTVSHSFGCRLSFFKDAQSILWLSVVLEMNVLQNDDSVYPSSPRILTVSHVRGDTLLWLKDTLSAQRSFGLYLY